jgi:N-methylhydantoinase B/oxoprolinase/acetone carboxylase alpha subunit
VTVPEDTIVSARWPVAVSGFVMPFEKIMNSIFELWSRLMPERAMACAFNIEYLQTGGYDARFAQRPYFMLYDWLSGGWGGRNGKDGLGATASCFGVGLMIQPVEGQERLCPVQTDRFEIVTDSAGQVNSAAASASTRKERYSTSSIACSPISATASARVCGHRRRAALAAAWPVAGTGRLQQNSSVRCFPTCR